MAHKITKAVLKQAAPIIDDWAAYQAYQFHVPGMSIGIVLDGELLHTGNFGFANIAKKKRPTSRTNYRIASISKTFTATAIMTLVQDRKLGLDDRIQQHLPWFRSPKASSLNKLTIRDILRHSTGLTRDGNTTHWEDDRFPDIKSLRHQIEKGEASALEPNRVFKYSNFAMSILGEVIQKVSGESYDEYVQRVILKPLGMSRTSSDYAPKWKDSLATGYSRYLPDRPVKPIPHSKTHGMAAATGFLSNVEDLAKYAKAHFPGNTAILSDRSKREMQKVQFQGADRNTYGLGWWSGQVEGMKAIGHSGGYPGFSSRLELVPSKHLVIMVLTNTTYFSATLIERGILRILKYIASQYQAPKNNYSAYTGMYTNRWYEINVAQVGNRLITFEPFISGFLDRPSLLRKTGPDVFKIEDGTGDDYIGELARFRKRKGSRRARSMLYGPEPMTRFKLPG